MDAAEYKHVVLVLIFLKYISEWCNERLPGNMLWRYGSSPPASSDNERPATPTGQIRKEPRRHNQPRSETNEADASFLLT